MGNPEFKIYDLDQVTIDFAGVKLNSGFSPDGAVKITPWGDKFSRVEGTDGSVTRSKTNSKGASVEITLMQTAEANAKLSTIHNTDLKASNGAGVAPFMVRDRQGKSLFLSPHAWIVAPPEAEYTNEAKARVWKFDAADCEHFDGGN